MAKWLAKEFDWDTGRYTGRYYDISEAGIVAVFVDSFYGDDASADPEDPDLPLKTLGAAITYLNTNGANGSRIFMNGIFSETLPAQTYWYDYIGCGGGINGRAVFYYNSSAGTLVIVKRSGNRYHNIRTLNYQTGPNDATRFQYEGQIVYYLNCLFVNTHFGKSNNQTSLRSYYTIFKGCGFERFESPLIPLSITAWSSIFYDCEYTFGIYTALIHGYICYINNRNFNQNTDSLQQVEAQFINVAQNDFNVRITSPLLGAGTVDEITGIAANVGGVEVGLPYNGISPEFTTEGGATITDLTIDANGKFTITAPATSGTLETALMDLGNIYPLENIYLFNVFDFLSGEITQGVFETFSSPRMALTIKLKYGLTSAEVDDCPWLLIEYGKQPTFSGTGASRVGNAADTFDPDTFQTITCRYMKLFVTLQNNS